MNAPVSDRVYDWNPDEVDAHYTMGHCHVMALALSRATGLPLGIMWSGLDWHVEPDAEGLGGVKEIVHVYVDAGDGTVLDVRGLRPLDDMRREFAGVEWDVCPCAGADEDEIARLVAHVGNLAPFDDDMVDEAAEVVRRSPVLSEAVARYGTGPRPGA